MVDTVWAGSGTPGGEKLYLQSGEFSATLKTSLDVSGVDVSLTGISWDGTNTPWSGYAADKLYLQSGQFSATLKTSVSIGGIDGLPQSAEHGRDRFPTTDNQRLAARNWDQRCFLMSRSGCIVMVDRGVWSR